MEKGHRNDIPRQEARTRLSETELRVNSSIKLSLKESWIIKGTGGNRRSWNLESILLGIIDKP